MDMESQAHTDETKQRISDYQASILNEMRRGHSLYPFMSHAWNLRLKKPSEAVKRSFLQLYIVCN